LFDWVSNAAPSPLAAHKRCSPLFNGLRPKAIHPVATICTLATEVSYYIALNLELTEQCCIPPQPTRSLFLQASPSKVHSQIPRENRILHSILFAWSRIWDIYYRVNRVVHSGLHRTLGVLACKERPPTGHCCSTEDTFSRPQTTPSSSRTGKLLIIRMLA